MPASSVIHSLDCSIEQVNFHEHYLTTITRFHKLISQTVDTAPSLKFIRTLLFDPISFFLALLKLHMEFHDSHSGSFTLRWLRSKILEYHTFSTSLLWTRAYPSPFKKKSFTTTDTTTTTTRTILTRSLETQFMHRIWNEPADYFEEVYFVERDADHEAAVVELVRVALRRGLSAVGVRCVDWERGVLFYGPCRLNKSPT
ncbi:hypothetical protein BJ741DRAFT_618027 [Chytriomyces cf. hyalinus JEL632]|nr:hypothetical protein BJ741DRAFT_618027 [Chytriomyces cf. hyalinus JEL632]